MQAQLTAHMLEVNRLSAELQEAEERHGALVRQLHSAYAPKSSVEQVQQVLTVRSALDGSLEHLPIELGDVLHLEGAGLEGISEEDKRQAEELVLSLKKGLREHTRAFFPAAIEKADAIKSEHEDLLTRLAVKK
eukprot:4233932-Pyramimonas_sp.AAC.1